MTDDVEKTIEKGKTVSDETNPTADESRLSDLLDTDDEDICGLCGLPGANKYAHPIHWPGEQIPDGPLVHAACEEEECRRAHSLLSDGQRRAFLRGI